MSNLVAKLTKSIGTQSTFATAYHPQTNGLTEHFNGTHASMLAMYTRTDQKNWDSYVPLVTFAYNTSIQSTTKESPFMVVCMVARLNYLSMQH